MYWIGLQPGDVHLNISSPGWAKHAWSNVFAPWNARRDHPVLEPRAVLAPPALLEALGDCRVTTFCAPPTVWRMLHPGRPGRGGRAALRECVAAGRAAQPRGHRAGAQGLGHHGPRRLRPDRDHRAGRQHAGPAGEARARWAGRCPATRSSLVDPLTGEPGREGEICLDLARRPLGLMTGYQDDPERDAEAMRGRLLPHRRRRHRRRRRLHHLRRPHRRRVQGVGLPHLPVRAGERADRARGGGRGRRGPVAGPAAARRAQGLRAARRRLRRRRRGTGAGHHGVLPRAGRRPTSASAGSSSPTCPRRSPARSAASSCAARKRHPANRPAASPNSGKKTSPGRRGGRDGPRGPGPARYGGGPGAGVPGVGVPGIVAACRNRPVP